ERWHESFYWGRRRAWRDHRRTSSWACTLRRRSRGIRPDELRPQLIQLRPVQSIRLSLNGAFGHHPFKLDARRRSPRRTRACPFAPPCQRSRTGSCRDFGSGAARCLGRLRCLDADSASECPELLLLLEGGEPLLEELERRRARILRQRPELSC